MGNSTAMQPLPSRVLVQKRERGTTSLMNPPTVYHHRLPVIQAPSSRVIRWVDEISCNSFTASRPTDEMLQSGSVMKMPSGTISGSFSNQHVEVALSPAAESHAASARSHLPTTRPKKLLRKVARLLSLGTNETSHDNNESDAHRTRPLPRRGLRRTATGVQQHYQQRNGDNTPPVTQVDITTQHTIVGSEKRRMRKSPSMSNYADSRRQFDSLVNRLPKKVDAVDVLGHNRRATGPIAIRPATGFH